MKFSNDFFVVVWVEVDDDLLVVVGANVDKVELITDVEISLLKQSN